MSELATALSRSIQRHSTCPAVAAGSKIYTYRALARKTLRIRRALQRHGVNLQRPVIVDTKDSLHAICAMVAVLEAGGCYAVLPVGTSQDEKDEQLHRLAAEWALCTPHYTPDMREQILPGLVLSHLPTCKELPHASGAPTLPAAVYFTSGTTGTSKGVKISCETILREAKRQSQAFRITSNDRIGLLFNPAFSASISAIYTSLLTGASIHLFDQHACLPPSRVAVWLSEENITLCDFTTTTFRHVCRELIKTPRPLSLRLVSAGAEKVREVDFARFKAALGPDCLFQITLASTETRVASELLLGHGDQWPKADTPLGRALSGTTITVLDEDRNPLPVGQVGLLSIRGRTMSPGYWDDPALTSKHFKFHSDGSTTFYSSDFGRMGSDGSVYFEERGTDVINLRGMKFSLKKLEGTLGRLWGFEVSLVHHTEAGLILACYEGEELPDSTRATCLQAAMHRVHSAVVPAALIHMEYFPRTPNGKLDQRQLLAEARAGLPYPTQASPEAEQITSFLRILLNQPGLEPEDSFFLSGGDSISAVEYLLWLEKTFSTAFTLEHLIANPSPLLLAESLGHKPGPTLFSTIQHSSSPGHLVFVPGMHGQVTPLIPLANALGENISVNTVRYSDTFRSTVTAPGIEERAENLAASIPWGDLSSPIILCGYSFGGLVAFELAHVLKRAGQPVDRVWMIDTFCPTAGRPPSRSPRVLTQRLYREAWQSRKDLLGWIRLNQARAHRYLSARRPGTWGSLDIHEKERMMLTHAVRRYAPAVLNLPLTLFLATENRGDSSCNDIEWRRLTTEAVTTVLCSGSHETLLRLPFRNDLMNQMAQHLSAER